MAEKYLTLWLEGPLQSWGCDSLFSRRDTLNFPTLSGVMGMICAAMGIQGKASDFLAKFSAPTWRVYSFQGQNSWSQPIKVSRLEDFHMVGSHYDESDGWEKLLIPKTNEGKSAVGGGAKLTYRYYLQNAQFGVVVGIPEELAHEIYAAFLSPKWPLCLGRKSCVPTEIVFQGIYSNLDVASGRAYEIASAKKKVFSFAVSNEVADADEILSLKDVPVEFGVNKTYRDRLVAIAYARE